MDTDTVVTSRHQHKEEMPKAVRKQAVRIIGTKEYADWLEAAHRQTRIPKVQIFRLAVEEWAARNDFPPPPEM